jgi:hypothetical protein
MYRLAPNLPLVWTSASSIQVGIDPPRARVDNIPDNAAPLLHALSQGTPASGLAMLARVHRVSQAWVDHLVASLRPAFTEPSPPHPVQLEAWSASQAITGLSALARQCGVDMTVPDVITHDTVPTGNTVVLVADYLVHPHWADLLLRENVPHASLVFSDQTIRVGPLVTPGHTPCLGCVELHRRDEMVGWLEVSSQLWGKASPLHTHRNIGMAWALLLMLLCPGGITGMTPGFTSALFRPDNESVCWQEITFHPRCSCRGLQ